MWIPSKINFGGLKLVSRRQGDRGSSIYITAWAASHIWLEKKIKLKLKLNSKLIDFIELFLWGLSTCQSLIQNLSNCNKESWYINFMSEKQMLENWIFPNLKNLSLSIWICMHRDFNEIFQAALIFDRLKVNKYQFVTRYTNRYSIIRFKILIGSKLKYKIKYEDWRLVCLKMMN